MVNGAVSRRRPFLLFVHGSWHGSWCFENYLGFFGSHGIGAAAIDLRGHGGLPQDDVFIRSGQQEMAGDVEDAVKHLDRDVLLVGHSAGAAISAIAASNIPTAGLVLLAPSPPGQLSIGNILPPVPDGAPTPPPNADTAQSQFFPNASKSDCEALCQNLVPESPTLLNDRRLRRTEIARERISGPTMVIAAGRDDPTMHAPGQDLEVARFYGAEYHFTPEAGHTFMVEPNWRYEANIIFRWYDAKFPQFGTVQ